MACRKDQMGLGYESLPLEYLPLLESEALGAFVASNQAGIDAVW
jgi:hypothetical protein